LKRRGERITEVVGWHRPLAALRDGRVIETLAQTAGLMTQRLPKQRQLKPIGNAPRRC
jgi:hypothetical protein